MMIGQWKPIHCDGCIIPPQSDCIEYLKLFTKSIPDFMLWDACALQHRSKNSQKVAGRK